MTDHNYVHYVLIIDRSGSMSKIKDDATGGIRQFVKDQADLLKSNPGRAATLSLYQFDTTHETVHNFCWLSEAANYVLRPRGGTALLDAVGFAVTQVGEKLAEMPEHNRPGKVFVLIVTDGQENSSKEYTKEQVQSLVKQQADKYGWQFTYIGANVDAFAEAQGIGIAVNSALGYKATGQSVNMAYASASAAVTRSVLDANVGGITYTDTERQQTDKA